MMLSHAETLQKRFIEKCHERPKISLLNTIVNQKYTVFKQLVQCQKSCIYLCINNQDKKQYIAKLYKLNCPESSSLQVIYRQILFMRQMKSDIFVKCYDCYIHQQYMVIIMEYCGESTLGSYIKKRKVSPQDAIEIIKQIYLAIEEIHLRGYTLRKLQLDSIFVKNGTFKLADLSFLHKDHQNPQLILPPPQNGTSQKKQDQTISKYQDDAWFLTLLYLKIIFHSKQKIENEYRSIDWITHPSLFTSNLQGQQECIDLTKAQKQFLKSGLKYKRCQRWAWFQMMKLQAFQNYDIMKSTRFLLQIDIYHTQQKQRLSVFWDRQIDLSVKEMAQKIAPQNLQWVSLHKSDIFYYCQEVDHEEQRLYEQLQILYFHAQRANYILNAIIKVIQTQNLLNLNKRLNVELMYLMSSRCFVDVSKINRNYLQQKWVKSSIYQIYRKKIVKIYCYAEKMFKKYSQLLTQKQNKWVEIIKDRLLSEQSKEKKNKFLTGIQHLDYNRQEQINYTQTAYLNTIQFSSQNPPENIVELLARYSELCLLQKGSPREFQDKLKQFIEI